MKREWRVAVDIDDDAVKLLAVASYYRNEHAFQRGFEQRGRTVRQDGQ